jgi:hypothetical protein
MTCRMASEYEPEAVSKIARFAGGTIRIDADGIVRIDFDPDTHVTLNVAKAEITALKRLTGGKRHPVLCDFGNVASTDLRARAYYGGQETRSAYSIVAFLTKSPMQKAIGNLFLAFHGRASGEAVRLFTSEREALEWLRAHGRSRGG